MNIAVIELEDKIRKIVSQDNGRIVIFEYEALHPKLGSMEKASRDLTLMQRSVLTVSTLNDATKEVTVMYKTKTELSKETLLAEVLNYLEIIKPTISPYHLRWKKKGEPSESQLSYFHCNDALEVLEKFFETRKREEYVIYSLEMKGYT